MKENGDRIAVFPGSFDPLTNGHVDVVLRALSHFEVIVVGVLDNPEKKHIFTVDERIVLIKTHFVEWGERVRVESFSGLLVHFVRSVGSRIILRGLRAISDFDYEAQMALINKTLDDGIETFFLTAREQNSYISSSLVKQIAPLGGEISKLVPPVVARELTERFG